MRKIPHLRQHLDIQCSFMKITTAQYIYSTFWIDLIGLILGYQMVYCSTEIKHLSMDKPSLEGHQCRKIRKNHSVFSAIHDIAHSEEECEERSPGKKKGLNILTLNCTKFVSVTLISS